MLTMHWWSISGIQKLLGVSYIFHVQEYIPGAASTLSSSLSYMCTCWPERSKAERSRSKQSRERSASTEDATGGLDNDDVQGKGTARG